MRIASLFVVVLLALFPVPSMAKWDQEAKASDLLSRMQIRVDHLALVANEAADGNVDAFSSLKLSRDDIDSMLQRLKHGDPRNGMSGYADQDSFKHDLAGLDAAWAKLNADVAALLAAKQQVVDARSAADEFAAQIAVLNSRTDEAVKILVEKDGSKNQLFVAQREMLHADRMLRRVQSVLHGGDEAVSAAAGLQRDSALYGIVLTGLILGNVDLNIKAVTNASAREILSDMNKQWIAMVAPSVSKLLEAAPALQSARHAADEIQIDSQTFVLKADPLSRHLRD